VFRLTFRCPSSSMKHLVFRFISSQDTSLYPLCHKLHTISSCSCSSPPGAVFCRLKITKISPGLFIMKPHTQSSAVHALSHTMTLDERLTWHSKPIYRKQEEESSSDYYHRDQIKRSTVFINNKRASFLQ
jgi:hypothetical protein